MSLLLAVAVARILSFSVLVSKQESSVGSQKADKQLQIPSIIYEAKAIGRNRPFVVKLHIMVCLRGAVPILLSRRFM